jgi:translocation protein SEC62
VSRRFRIYYLRNNLLTPYTVKRALRALQSPAYAKARSKNPLLPEVTDRASLENTFKLLPLSLIALRVSKVDPNEGHEGHNHAPPPKTKRIKGLWTVKIEQQQDCKEELHYVWLYEGSQIKTKLYAAGALLVIFAIVLFPLWPMKMRLGVWYLSMGLLGLIGLFFAMSIVRLIIWGITAIALPVPWLLFPNLFEDGQLLVQLSRISCIPSPFLFPFPSHFSASTPTNGPPSRLLGLLQARVGLG